MRTLLALFASTLLALPGVASAKSPAGAVDWANHTYTVEGQTVTLKNGAWGKRHGDEDDGYEETLNFTGALSGDLDGDGIAEHVVSLQYWGGGTGRLDDIRIYRVAGAQTLYVADLPGGDRGHGGIIGLKIEDAGVVLTRMASLEWDGACCPSMAVTERWVWRAGRMVRDVERGMVSPMEDEKMPGDRAALLAEGRKAMASEKRDVETAIDTYLKALRVTPGDPKVLGELGFALMKAERHAHQAEAALWAAARPGGPAKVRAAALYNLGKLYLQQKDAWRAGDALQRSLVLRPGNGPTEKLLAEALAARAATKSNGPL